MVTKTLRQGSLAVSRETQICDFAFLVTQVNIYLIVFSLFCFFASGDRIELPAVKFWEGFHFNENHKFNALLGNKLRAIFNYGAITLKLDFK